MDQVLVGDTIAAGCEQIQQKGHLVGQGSLPCSAGTHWLGIFQALSDTFGPLGIPSSQRLPKSSVWHLQWKPRTV